MHFFSESTPHRDEIVTSHHNWNVSHARAVHRIRVIANMDNSRPLSEPGPQFSRKQDELVDVSEPLADEIFRPEKFSQNRSRRRYFSRNSGSSQPLQHHNSEALHA